MLQDRYGVKYRVSLTFSPSKGYGYIGQVWSSLYHGGGYVDIAACPVYSTEAMAWDFISRWEEMPK